MRKLKLALCLMLSLSAATPLVQAQTSSSLERRELVQRFWMAFQGGDKMLTNMDVEDYICNTNMSDEMMISLFKEAGEDYDKYKVLRRKWAQQRFDSGLRQYAYIYSLQKYATNPLYNKDGRRAFNITQSEYFEQVQEMESQTLKQWLQPPNGVSLGIVKARDLFGAELKKIGYPHSQEMSNTDLYFEWYNIQKERIREGLRMREVQKFEYLSALGYKREFYVRPTDMFDFKRDVEEVIATKLTDKRMTTGTLTKVIEEDPRVSVLLKNVELLGPDNTKLTTLKDQASEVYQEYVDKLSSETLPKIEESIRSDILRYEGIAQKLVQKYVDAERLRELSEEMKRSFLLGEGDYNHFMMSRLYNMAALIIEQGEAFKGSSEEALNQKENYITELRAKALKVAQDVMKNPEVAGTARLEDHFISELNSDEKHIALREEMAADEYMREFRVMANWVVKFQFKKASLSVTPIAKTEIHDAREYEGQKRITDYLKGLYYEKDLDRFRRETMRNRGPYIVIDNGTKRLTADDAWNFVLEKFPKTRTR